jgi:peptide/nickel transport system permease protein
LIAFIFKRAAYMVFSLIAATVIVFTLSRLQGDPRNVLISGYLTQEIWDAWGEKMGLDKPLVVQYLIWLKNAVQGDFGTSINDARPALDMILERAPATLQLSSVSWLLAMIVGIPLGVLSAVRRSTGWDYFARVFALVGQALPPFWLGLMLILTFSVTFELFPAGTRGGPSHYVLPAITLAWTAASGILRLMRSAMLEVLDSEFVKLARAKGVKSHSIVWKHAARNAMIAPLTFAGLLLAAFMAGTVVTETVFAWPGLGRLAVDAVLQNDYPVMTGVVMVLTFLYLFVAFLVDITYAFVDPRIRIV